MLARTRAFITEFKREFGANQIDDVAAMMTYYAIFALFPMLIFVVTVALLVVPQDWIDSGVMMAASAMPRDAAALVSEQVTRMENAAGAEFAIGSALIALWGASRGAAALMFALDSMYETKETRPWWKRQLIAIGTTLTVAFLLVVAMGLIAAGPAVGHAIADGVGLGNAFDTVWDVARWAVAGFLVMLVWALMYKWLPDVDRPLRIFTPGAIVGVMLWFGVTKAFSYYLDTYATYEQTYGAVASVIVFMTWLWLSNLTLLLGAEINDVLVKIRQPVSSEVSSTLSPGKPSKSARWARSENSSSRVA